MLLKTTRVCQSPVLFLPVILFTCSAFAGNAVYTTTKDGTAVNGNIYAVSTDVNLIGGPQHTTSSGLPDGKYYSNHRPQRPDIALHGHRPVPATAGLWR